MLRLAWTFCVNSTLSAGQRWIVPLPKPVLLQLAVWLTVCFSQSSKHTHLRPSISRSGVFFQYVDRRLVNYWCPVTVGANLNEVLRQVHQGFCGSDFVFVVVRAVCVQMIVVAVLPKLQRSQHRERARYLLATAWNRQSSNSHFFWQQRQVLRQVSCYTYFKPQESLCKLTGLKDPFTWRGQ